MSKNSNTQGAKMKTKILSVCIIAGLFTGCNQILPPLPQAPSASQNTNIDKELIKGIKTDGKGGYYVMDDEDCKTLIQAGVFTNRIYSKLPKVSELDDCESVALENMMADAANVSYGADKDTEMKLKPYVPYKRLKY